MTKLSVDPRAARANKRFIVHTDIGRTSAQFPININNKQPGYLVLGAAIMNSSYRAVHSKQNLFSGCFKSSRIAFSFFSCVRFSREDMTGDQQDNGKGVADADSEHDELFPLYVN